MTIDERISAELRRHAPEVDEPAAWDRIRSRSPVQRRLRTIRLVAIPVSAAGLLLVGSVLISSLSSSSGPAGDPESPLLGTWVAMVGDGSAPSMVIDLSTDDVVEMVVVIEPGINPEYFNDFVAVCSGAPSTMTATGQFQSDNVLVFPSQVLTCEDGSQPEARTGPSLRERLQTLIFTYLPNGDILTDNFGSVWSREGADPSPGPTTPPPPDWEVDNTPGIMWPQKNLEEVRVAQELADAGDPDYTWQLEPNMDSILTSEGQVETPEIIAGFVRREFGWEEFALVGGSGTDNFVYGGFHVIGAQLIRCEPGKRNPLWPDDPRFGGCAPTIDLTHYETVGIFVTQPGEQGPEGIWVASFASESDPLRQMVPMTEDGLGALLESFLQARIAGEGAEQYLGTPDDAQHFEIPLLYATSTGAPYERAEFEVEAGEIEDLGPRGGDIGVNVRLFAEGGQTVVEQTFELEAGGGLGHWVIYQHEGDQTTENGVPLPRP